MNPMTLHDVVVAHPFPDYQDWWPMGDTFVRFMSDAIYSTWMAGQVIPGLEEVERYVETYIQVVYGREVRPNLVPTFIAGSIPIYSGEFDALSYAFFRSAFEQMANQPGTEGGLIAVERRRFTQQVGKRFYDALHRHLNLDLPQSLADEAAFRQLQTGIEAVGRFLVVEGYLRDHFGFHFSVDVTHGGKRIQQNSSLFLDDLNKKRVAYALYEMGYPAILPSAVYLYNTIGEAQHHSSRTIEELFERVGYSARETDDFDPSAFPSQLVIELWEIKPASLGLQVPG